MNKRLAIFLNSVAFVAGFTIVFSVIGVLLQTLLAQVAFDASNILRTIGGIVIAAFGIALIASLKYSIPFLGKDHKMRTRNMGNRYMSSAVFGMAFAAGWSACAGFILGAIYTLAATSPGAGFALMLTYSLGLGIPFLIVGAFISQFSGFLEKSQKFLKYFNIISGIFLIIIGILIITNWITLISGAFVSAEGAVDVEGTLNFTIAFIAGVITFLSPCILPLIPAFLSYMAGTTVEEIRKKG